MTALWQWLACWCWPPDLRPEPIMNVPRSVADVLNDHVVFEVECMLSFDSGVATPYSRSARCFLCIVGFTSRDATGASCPAPGHRNRGRVGRSLHAARCTLPDDEDVCSSTFRSYLGNPPPFRWRNPLRNDEDRVCARST